MLKRIENDNNPLFEHLAFRANQLYSMDIQRQDNEWSVLLKTSTKTIQIVNILLICCSSETDSCKIHEPNMWLIFICRSENFVLNVFEIKWKPQNVLYVHHSDESIFTNNRSTMDLSCVNWNSIKISFNWSFSVANILIWIPNSHFILLNEWHVHSSESEFPYFSIKFR